MCFQCDGEQKKEFLFCVKMYSKVYMKLLASHKLLNTFLSGTRTVVSVHHLNEKNIKESFKRQYEHVFTSKSCFNVHMGI